MRQHIAPIFAAISLCATISHAAPVTATPATADKAPWPGEPVPLERPTGVEAGFSTSFEIPVGKIGDGPDGKISNVLGPRFLLTLDVGYRVTSQWRVAGRVSGFAGPLGSSFSEMCSAGSKAMSESDEYGNDDSADISCAQYGAGGSVHVRYDLRKSVPLSGWAPWVSFGSGAEIVGMTGSSAGSTEYNGSVSGSMSGLNYAIPELGVDWRFAPRGVMTFFAIAKIGRYSESAGKVESFDDSASMDFGDPTVHTWIGGGFGIAGF